MERETEIKCIVWDLDGTIWDGVLLENDDVVLKPGVKEAILTLDSRGILHSIASKNDSDDAMQKLREFGLEEYFLYPEINWNAKSASIASIIENLKIGADAIMFIDDDPRQRDEVSSEHPDVVCVDASQATALAGLARLNPRFVTDDSRRRRQMYLADIRRKKDEREYQGPKKDFLASLNIQLVISEAREGDLERAEELTVRTNQLNTTGRTYSYEELREFMDSRGHRLIVCEMKDKYGNQGKIGLALIETAEGYWGLRLLLMSCRVMSLGIGTVLLSYILKTAKQAGKKLRADFRDTGRNRMMYITFMFANFKKAEQDDDGNIVLESDLSRIQDFPPYMDITVL